MRAMVMRDFGRVEVFERGARSPAPGTHRGAAPGEALAATIEALWEARVRWVTDGLSPAGRAALVLAARLGPVVAPGPWERACAAAEVDGRAEVEARLVDARLARRHPCGFGFAHDGVRAAITLRSGPPPAPTASSRR